MLEGEPPFANYEPYEGAKCVAEGHRPNFRAKGYIPELREYDSFSSTHFPFVFCVLYLSALLCVC